MNTCSDNSSGIEFAREIRKYRSEIKKRLKTGNCLLHDLFENKLLYEKYIANMCVFDILVSLPGYGKVKAEKVLEKLHINQCKKISGLGKKQMGNFNKYFGLNLTEDG